nr:cytochrome P450 4AV17 [Meteorus pulchricornis]
MKNQETSTKSFGHAFLEPAIINCLFNGQGPEMKARRKALVPIINGVHLKHYTKVFNEHTHRAVDDLTKRINMGEFDIYDEIESCIADMAFETIFGIPGVARDHGDLTIPHASVVILETLYHRIITPWLHPSFIFNITEYGKAVGTATKTLHQYIRKLIREKRELHVKLERGDSSVNKPEPSILDIWMEDIVITNEATDDEILYEMIALFVGFHDTIIGVFSFIILTLAMHPDIQEKVRDEVISVIGSDAVVTEENVGKLKYIRMVILETMRLFPAGPLILRSVTNDVKIGIKNILDEQGHC